MFFFDTCNAVAAREDRKPKYWRLGLRHLGLSLTLWRQAQSASDCVMLLESITWDSNDFSILQEINKRRNMEINNHKPYSTCRVWRCDVTTSNSIQDGGALVDNILVFDLRVQLQHCRYQRKTLLFALIKVSTFICKWSPLSFSVTLVGSHFHVSSLQWLSYTVQFFKTLTETRDRQR